MALSEQEKELARQASFGDDIMKQRAAAVAIEDIRYDDAPAETTIQWNDAAPSESTPQWNDVAEDQWTDVEDSRSLKNTADPEVYNWLPDTVKIGFGDYTWDTGYQLSDQQSAFLVTMGEAMSTVYRGTKQKLGIDVEEMRQASKAVDKLYEDEALRGSAITGEIVGALVEPAGFMVPGGKAKSAIGAITKGAAIGGAYGAGMYTEEDQTILGNTLMGGTIGAAINRTFHGVRNIFAAKASKKARADLEKMEKYWAQEMLRNPDAAKIANAQKKMPSIVPSQDVYARAALNRMFREDKNFSLIAAKEKGGRMLNPPRNLEEAQFIIDSYGTDKTRSSLTKLADNFLGITSTRIGNIDEGVKGMVRGFDYAVKQEAHNYLLRVEPFMRRLSKVSGDKKTALNKALLEGRFDAVRREMTILGKDAVAEFEDFNRALVELGGRAKKAGLIKELVNNYVPRYIKDPDAYMKEIGKTNRVDKGAVDSAIKKAEAKASAAGQTLGTEAKSQIIHRVIFGSRSTKAPRSSFTYEQKLKEIPDYLMPHYASPEEAVHSYIRNIVTDIYKRDFFGKSARYLKLDDEYKLLDIDKSAATFVEQRLKHLSSAESKELMGLLSSRFGLGEKAPMAWIQDAKNMMYAALLGNPISAATQLGDLGVSVYINGFRNTMKGVLQSTRIPFTEKTLLKKDFTVKDWGVLDQLAEEFATTRRTARWLNRAFKYSGFQYVDRLGKDTFINASYLRLKQMPRTKFMAKYGRELGDSASKTYDDLVNGVPSTEVKALLFSKLADVQPISPSEVPQAYLNAPNNRMLYMFKTFMLKQVDVVRQTAWKEFSRGNYGKGMKNLMSYGIIMGSSGLASQDVKNLMLGKDIEHEDLPLDIGMNLFKTFGWSEYALDRIKNKQPIEAIADQVLPPYAVIDRMLQGDPKTVPGVGQIYYYWFGGGIEEYIEKQRKEKIKKAKEPITDLKKEIKERISG